MHDAGLMSDTYYAMREAQERAAAGASRDPGARRVHLELARRYAALTRDDKPRAIQVVR